MRMRAMKLNVWMAGLLVLAGGGAAHGQLRPTSAEEYIRSTSPLAGGGRVISQTAPGQGVQTVTTIAQLPSVNQRNSVQAGYQPRTAGMTSVLSVPRVAANTNGSSYAYPATNQPSPVASGLFSNQNTFRPATVQSNTLALRPTGVPAARLAQNCPTCVSGNGGAGAAFQPPALNGGVPPVNIQVPGQAAPQPLYQPNYQPLPGTIGTPQYGAQGANWWTPFVTGSGSYTPIIRLQNLPPGTYLGQGLIGQPTAYVDGQPVRNLLRYLAP